VSIEQKIIAPSSLCPTLAGGISLPVKVVIALGPRIPNRSLTGLDCITFYVVSALLFTAIYLWQRDVFPVMAAHALVNVTVSTSLSSLPEFLVISFRAGTHLPVSSYDSLKQVSGVASHSRQVSHLESAWKAAIRSSEQALCRGMLGGVRPLCRDILSH
jgi:hypothetical protein